MKLTATHNTLAIDYKKAGKRYNTTNAEAGGTADPFDTAMVYAGESFELGAQDEFIRVREFAPINPQGGTPEDVKLANMPDRADGTAPDQAKEISQYDRAGG